MQHFIIGAGVAGITAAKTLRDHDKQAKITVYTNEFHPLGFYSRKDLASRLAEQGDQLGDNDLLIESKAELESQGIEFAYQPVLRIVPEHHEVMRAHFIRKRYDRLLIATGATPRILDIPGIHLIGVHQVRNFEDIGLIQSWLPYLQEHGAVIIGGGLLALDMAYALQQLHIPVTLIVREPYIGAPLLPASVSPLIEQRLRSTGINVFLERTVVSYLSRDERLLDAVELDNGQVIDARMALNAIGVHPTTEFLEGSGIEVSDETGAVLVNSCLQTNIPDVYAAGNCANANGFIASNWMLSAEQGRIAALNMMGHNIKFNLTQPYDLNTRLYNLPFAYFGQLQPNGTDQVWIWQDGTSQFLQIICRDQRIQGAVLLGEPAFLAQALYDKFQARLKIQTEYLEQVLALNVEH